MPTSVSKPRSSSAKNPICAQKTGADSASLNQYLRDEISRLSETQSVSAKLLEDFALFVIEHHKKKDKKAPKPKKAKPLTLAQLKAAVYQHFGVASTAELKKSGAFKMATDGMDEFNLSSKEGWEKLYRKFIGILPNEEGQQGEGCINGINIFNYFKPWQVFGLDPKTATPQDIRKAYHDLSKIYHPDMPTGNPEIFERITVMYKSISAEA